MIGVTAPCNPATQCATNKIQRAASSITQSASPAAPKGASSAAIAEVFGPFGIRRTDRVGEGVHLISLERDPGLAKMKELQGKDPRLAAVQPNFIYRKSNWRQMQILGGCPIWLEHRK